MAVALSSLSYRFAAYRKCSNSKQTEYVYYIDSLFDECYYNKIVICEELTCEVYALFSRSRFW